MKTGQESALFRFTNQMTCSLEFSANITSPKAFAEDLGTALSKYAEEYPNRAAFLHMKHQRNWLLVNRDSSVETIRGRTKDPMLWAERIAEEVLQI